MTEQTHPDNINQAAQVIYDFLVAQGQATKNEVRDYCKGAEIGTELYQKAFQRLHRQMNLITEVTGDEGKKAWAVKDWAKGTAFSTALQVMADAGDQKKPREKYDNWYVVRGHFKLMSPCLASNPVIDNQSARAFFRMGDEVVFLTGYFEAMMDRATGKAGAPVIGGARYRIQWAQTTVSASQVVTTLRPVPPSRPGGSGQGVTNVESLPIGALVPFEAIVPGSHIDPAEFDALLCIAGQHVGFSPSAAHKGFGRFVPIIEQEVQLAA